MTMTLAEEYLSTVIRRLKYYRELGERAFEQIEEQDFHWQPSSESNSIAVIIQHLAGNMLSRWTNFLTEDGEKGWRDRDDEFEVHNDLGHHLIDLWNKGWVCFLDALTSLKEADLLKPISTRDESLSAIDAI